MKKKLFLLSIVVGCIFVIISIVGFYQLNDVKKTIRQYDGSNKIFQNVQDRDTYKTYDTYWDYLETNDCEAIRTTCYCDHVNNEKDCLNQFLNDGGGTYNNVSGLETTIMKFRFLWIILAVGSFICAWIFHEKKDKESLSEAK